jgi:hypothetical protein
MNTLLSLKADKIDVNDALATKSNVEDVNKQILAVSDLLNSAIATKATTTSVTASLATKANTSDLALKADKASPIIDNQLTIKSNGIAGNNYILKANNANLEFDMFNVIS